MTAPRKPARGLKFGPDGASATLSRKAEVEAQSGILIFRRVQGAHVSVPLRDVGISLVWGDSLKLDRRECPGQPPTLSSICGRQAQFGYQRAIAAVGMDEVKDRFILDQHEPRVTLMVSKIEELQCRVLIAEVRVLSGMEVR